MHPTALFLRRTIFRRSAAAAAIAAAGMSVAGLAGCEGSGSRTTSVDTAAASGAFDPGASEWGRRGPRREALPAPEPFAETADSSAAPSEPVAEAVVMEEAVVVASPDGSGWIGEDLLVEETAIAAAAQPAPPPSGAPAAVPERAAGEAPEAKPLPAPAATSTQPSSPAAVASEPATPAARVAAPVVPARATPPPTPVPVGDAERALAILRQAARSEDPAVRANAIESLLASPATLEEVVTAGLVDSNRGVRYVAAMCIGRARLSNLAHLVEPLVRDSSPSVRAAAIYALRRCGRPADPSMLAGMLRSDDPEIRSNAFAVLGELGDRSAAPMIRESLGKGMRRVNPIRVRIVELQGAEALVRLGQEEDIEAIRAALFAPVEQGELSILACQILARVGDQSSVPMLERLVQASGSSARPPEIRLAAAQAIAELGARTQLDLLALAGDAGRSPDPLVRMQAASLLGWLGGSAAESMLAAMLSDPVESVRVTAAGNLLRLARESAGSAAGRPMR